MIQLAGKTVLYFSITFLNSELFSPISFNKSDDVLSISSNEVLKYVSSLLSLRNLLRSPGRAANDSHYGNLVNQPPDKQHKPLHFPLN